MRIKLILDSGKLEYGIGLGIDSGLFRGVDSEVFRIARLWASRGRGVFQLGAWIRIDVGMEAIQEFFLSGAKKATLETFTNLRRLGSIAEALEKFAKQATDEGHVALGFALMSFSAVIEDASRGLPVDLEALELKINSGTSEARRIHEVQLRYADLAKGAVDTANAAAKEKLEEPDAKTE